MSRMIASSLEWPAGECCCEISSSICGIPVQNSGIAYPSPMIWGREIVARYTRTTDDSDNYVLNPRLDPWESGPGLTYGVDLVDVLREAGWFDYTIDSDRRFKASESDVVPIWRLVSYNNTKYFEDTLFNESKWSPIVPVGPVYVCPRDQWFRIEIGWRIITRGRWGEVAGTAFTYCNEPPAYSYILHRIDPITGESIMSRPLTLSDIGPLSVDSANNMSYQWFGGKKYIYNIGRVRDRYSLHSGTITAFDMDTLERHEFPINFENYITTDGQVRPIFGADKFYTYITRSTDVGRVATVTVCGLDGSVSIHDPPFPSTMYRYLNYGFIVTPNKVYFRYVKGDGSSYPCVNVGGRYNVTGPPFYGFHDGTEWIKEPRGTISLNHVPEIITQWNNGKYDDVYFDQLEGSPTLEFENVIGTHGDDLVFETQKWAFAHVRYGTGDAGRPQAYLLGRNVHGKEIKPYWEYLSDGARAALPPTAYWASQAFTKTTHLPYRYGGDASKRVSIEMIPTNNGNAKVVFDADMNVAFEMFPSDKLYQGLVQFRCGSVVFNGQVISSAESIVSRAGCISFLDDSLGVRAYRYFHPPPVYSFGGGVRGINMISATGIDYDSTGMFEYSAASSVVCAFGGGIAALDGG